MISFVRAHRAELEGMPSAFLSVSLSEAGVERATSAAQRAKAESDVRGLLDTFFAATGWNPSRVLPVAGALLYRRYGFIKRWMMRRISKASGGDTDTSKDFEYTDWKALDRFVVEMAAQLPV